MQKTFKYVENLPVLSKIESIENESGRKYKLPNGDLVPSITTVLSHFKRKSIQEWRNRVGHEEANKVSYRASYRGTKVHSLLEKYLENKPFNEIITESTMPDIKQSFLTMRPAVNRIDNIHFIECGLYSERLKLAGRTDVIAEFDGTLSVIDFKTSAKEKKEEWIQDYFIQSTAYAIMYEELAKIPVNQIVILMSTDGLPEPQLFIKDPNDYVDMLCQKVYDYHVAQKNRN
jgi:genome maintenance exonuclease 1